MNDLIVYLLAVCQCQSENLSAAHAVIREQAAALADVGSFIEALGGDFDDLERELDGIEAAL
jgi:hypothetical protein